MRQILGLLISAAALASIGGVVLGYGAPLIYQLDALAHFRVHLLILAVPVAFAALALGRWRALWWTLAAVVLAVVGLAPLWERELPRQNGAALSVMTANLYQRNPDSEGMRAALVEADADILVTHETSKAVQTGPDALTRHYPYRLALTTRGQTLRTVIWSKFPMRDGRLMLEDQIEPTGAHAAIAITPEVDVTVIALHLAHAAFGNQARQIAALDEIANTHEEPRIVLGDFNATPWSHAMREIERRTATRRIPGYRVTWRGRYKTPFGEIPSPIGQPIDHVLISPGLGVDAIETIEIPGSDHLGVRATLRVPPPE